MDKLEYRIDEGLVTARIVDINWERIFLSFDIKVTLAEGYECPDSMDFYVVNNVDKAKVKLKVLSVKDGIYRAQMNVTNNGENRAVPIGNYRILLCVGDDVMAECESDLEHPINLEEKSRNFSYANGNNTFAVDFYVEEDDEHLPFRMHILIAKRICGSGFPSNKDFKIEFPFKGIKKYVCSPRTFLRNEYRVLRRLYAKERSRTILFMTEQSGKLNSNIKAVYDRMIERGMDKEYTLLVSARPAAEPQSHKSWMRLVQMMAKSGLIFLDDHAPILDWLKLVDDTKVVQLWHAGAGFKSSGYSRWGHKGCPSPQSRHRQYTYGIAGSRSIAPFFSEVWGINDERVLPTGMPRMDEFLDEHYRKAKTKKLYEAFPLCKGKKVMLFAPTYRGKNKKTAYYPYNLIDFDNLYRLCAEEYVVLFKMHPWVSEAVPIPEKYKDKFIDVNTYPNINDLFYITDLLVTDYSSNIFEYSLMRKPMMFFAFDKAQYSCSRGFHRPYEESAPGKVCYTFAEFLEAFENKDFEYEKVEEYVEKHFDFIDSHSSDRVIDWIVLDQIPQDIKDEIAARDRENERMNQLDFTRAEEIDPDEVLADK